MNLKLLFSKIKLNEYVLINKGSLKSYNWYYQFHYALFFVCMVLIFNKPDFLITFLIIFIVGEMCAFVNYMLNKSNLVKYLLVQNIILYGVRLLLLIAYIVLLFSSLLTNIIILFTMLLLSIITPLGRINLATSKVKINSILLLIILGGIVPLIDTYIPLNSLILIAISFLAFLYLDLFTVSFSHLLFVNDVNPYSKNPELIKLKEEDLKVIVDSIKNKNILIESDFSIVIGHNLVYVKGFVGMVSLFIMGVISEILAFYMDINGNISEKYFYLWAILSLVIMFFSIIVLIIVSLKQPTKYFIFFQKDDIYIVKNDLLENVHLYETKDNIYWTGFDLIKFYTDSNVNITLLY